MEKEKIKESINPLSKNGEHYTSIVRNIKNENGLFHVNMPYRYGTDRHADILRSVKYYKSGKIMLNFRSGSYKLSSIDNKWWFYILKGVK